MFAADSLSSLANWLLITMIYCYFLSDFFLCLGAICVLCDVAQSRFIRFLLMTKSVDFRNVENMFSFKSLIVA